MSDTLTAFIGGTNDPQGIVTLDWTTMQYRCVGQPKRFFPLNLYIIYVVSTPYFLRQRVLLWLLNFSLKKHQIVYTILVFG